MRISPILVSVAALAWICLHAGARKADELGAGIELVTNPPLLFNPVANSLRLESGASRPLIVGQTDSSRRYQLMSPDLELPADAAGVLIEVVAEVLEGGMYIGLLDEEGEFLVPPSTLPQGAAGGPLPPIPIGRSRKVRLVIGNDSDGASRWRIQSLFCRALSASSAQLLADQASPDALPAGWSRPVPNTLRLRETGGRLELTGATDRTLRYQLLSPWRVLEERQQSVEIVFEGEVGEGAIYLVLLGGDGAFTAKPFVVSSKQGPVSKIFLAPAPRGGKVQLALGNNSLGVSRLHAARLGFRPLDSVQRKAALAEIAKRETASGSAWAWAWKEFFAPGREYPVGSFSRENLGALPPGLERTIPGNDFRLVDRDGRLAVEGTTDASMEYQLRTPSLEVEAGHVAVAVDLEGEVLQGRAYWAVLDHRGRYLSPPSPLTHGEFAVSDRIIPLRGAWAVSLVIGNGGLGRSKLRIRKTSCRPVGERGRRDILLRLGPSNRTLGSAWTWAWERLAGNGQPRSGTP